MMSANRWIDFDGGAAKVHEKKIWTRAKIPDGEIVERIGRLVARDRKEDGKTTIDLQLPDRGKIVTYYVSQKQAAHIKSQAGEGFEFVFEGLLEAEA